MRKMGTWTEEINIYKPQERDLKFDKSKNAYIYHGHEYPKDEVSKDKYGTLTVDHGHGERKSIGIELDGKPLQGFNTLSKKLEFYSSWMAEWKWPEYAIPVYPTSKEERKKIDKIIENIIKS